MRGEPEDEPEGPSVDPVGPQVDGKTSSSVWDGSMTGTYGHFGVGTVLFLRDLRSISIPLTEERL